jgi:hypothetical protein
MRDNWSELMDIVNLLFPNALRHDRTPAVGRVDEIGYGPDPVTVTQRIDVTRIPQGAYLQLRGWAIDAQRKRPAAGVMVVTDGRFNVEARYGEARDDIARYFETPSLLHCGFTALLPTGRLEAGEHRFSVAVIGRSIEAYSLLDQVVVVTLAPSVLDLQIGTAPSLMSTAHSIDAIGPVGSAGGSASSRNVEWGSEVIIEGWAVDTVARELASGCYVEIDDHHFVRAQYGFPRPDVAQDLDDARYMNSGFRAQVSSACVGLGAHDVRLIVLSADGSEYYRSDRTAEFTVLP